jgi:patatin-like phospholipase/acyl hydrolase
MKKILSIDGGGIRGIIPASVLIKLEQQTNKPVRECFDFIAGTSTGALITAAVAAGVSAERILAIYTGRSNEIFSPPQPLADVKRVAEGYMYDPNNIKNVLVSEFGAAANWAINDSPVKILITAKAANRHPWYFVPDNPKNAQTTGKFPLVDCAVSSACGPTYFKPWNIPEIGWLFDGGTGIAANPVYQACVEAFYYDTFVPEETLVVSLGTGYFPGSSDPPSGLLATISWVVDTLLSSSEGEQLEIVRRHIPCKLQRFNWLLPKYIDQADTGSIPQLVQVGQQAAAQMNWPSILGDLGQSASS